MNFSDVPIERSKMFYVSGNFDAVRYEVSCFTQFQEMSIFSIYFWYYKYIFRRRSHKRNFNAYDWLLKYYKCIKFKLDLSKPENLKLSNFLKYFSKVGVLLFNSASHSNTNEIKFSFSHSRIH